MLVKYYVDDVWLTTSDTHFENLKENSTIYIDNKKFIVVDINMCMESLLDKPDLYSYLKVHIMPV